MSDNTNNPFLIVGSFVILAMVWLIVIAYWLISPFIPYKPTEAQKIAFLEALGVTV